MRIRSHSWVVPASMTAAAIVTLGLIGTFAKLKAASGGVPTGLAVMLSIFGLAGVLLAYAGPKGLIGLARHGSWTLECRDGGGVFGEALPVRILPELDPAAVESMLGEMGEINIDITGSGEQIRITAE